MCSESSRLWRSTSPALFAVLMVVVLVGCLSSAQALPATHRSDANSAANSADNGLRQSHSPRGGHGHGHKHCHRTADPPRLLCGKALRDELATICAGRGYYNGYANARGPKFGGAATHCCDHGCTRRDLDSYCNPPSDGSPVSESIEQVSEASSSYEVSDTVTSNNQLRTNPVVQEEPQSVSFGANTQQDTETENTLVRESIKNRYYVKTNDYHQINSPVTPRRQSSIR